LPVQTDQAGGALAKAALLTIAAGLFGGLIAAFVVSLRNPEMPANVDGVAQTGQVTTPASSAVVEELSMANVVARLAEGSVSAEELDRLVATDMARAVKESRLDLTTMSFELGTLQLTGQAQEMVDQLGALLTEDPAIPVSALVRTYSERTAAENLALSQAQAEALVQALEVAGAAPGQVRAVGLGAIPLSPAHPVPDFVAVTPPFGDASLSAIIDNEPRFVVGNGVETVATHSAWSLRLEGLAPMTRVGQAVRSDGEATVGLAGYSFFAPTDERNDAVAKASAETVAQFLNSTYGIERQRISVITPGSAPYVPPAEVGNLIWLAAGPQSQTAHDLAAIDATAITFSGSTLSTEGQAAVEDLAAALTGSGAEIVIAVRSYDGDGTAANLALSQARGQALADSLASAGVAARQVRIEASGASTYLPADGALVSLTAVP
ncbi:MAG: hypothetical protein OER95_16525, partial [Acidimicrobiia bacterium]|nr:hypothetical protein [Acidimicrobiia bacterium]